MDGCICNVVMMFVINHVCMLATLQENSYRCCRETLRADGQWL